MDNMILESRDVMRRNNWVPVASGVFQFRCQISTQHTPPCNLLAILSNRTAGDIGQSSSRATTSIYFDNRTVTVLMATKLEGLLC
eukprot:scaffold12792_cov73-Skeletonema_marinoi.AAC.2